MPQFDLFMIPKIANLFAALFFFIIFYLVFFIFIINWLSGVNIFVLKTINVNEASVLWRTITNNRDLHRGLFIITSQLGDLLEQFILVYAWGWASVVPILAIFFWFFGAAQALPKVFYAVCSFVKLVINDILGSRVLEFSKNWMILSAIFALIVFSNLIGMVPHSFAITSSFTAPFFISLAVFLVYFYAIISKGGISFFAGFLPSGTNSAIAPLIIVIEVISTCAKFVSLGVRLFANIFAGHLLLKVFYAVCFQVLATLSFLMILGDTLAFGFILAVTLLEVMIACLQAFVMLLLAVLYLDESNNFINAH